MDCSLRFIIKVGRYGREKQYGDAFETALSGNGIKFERERILPFEGIENQNTSKADFVIENTVVVELKAKPIVAREDYDQIQRYLQAGGFKLGLLVNFRNKYLKLIRIIRLNS